MGNKQGKGSGTQAGSRMSVMRRRRSVGADQRLLEGEGREANEEDEEVRFIVNFVSATDIPVSASGSNSRVDPFIRAYLSVLDTTMVQEAFGGSSASGEGVMGGEGSMANYLRISDTVETIVRTDCTSVVWNNYRNFCIMPPASGYLSIEMHNAHTSSDSILGSVHVPIASLMDEELKHFDFAFHGIGDATRNPHFSIALKRVFIDAPPPRLRTFFLLRHGESKWNRAQASGDLVGMMERDHALTDIGIAQAAELNAKWQQFVATGELEEGVDSWMRNVNEKELSEIVEAAAAPVSTSSSLSSPASSSSSPLASPDVHESGETVSRTQRAKKALGSAVSSIGSAAMSLVRRGGGKTESTPLPSHESEHAPDSSPPANATTENSSVSFYELPEAKDVATEGKKHAGGHEEGGEEEEEDDDDDDDDITSPVERDSDTSSVDDDDEGHHHHNHHHHHHHHHHHLHHQQLQDGHASPSSSSAINAEQITEQQQQQQHSPLAIPGSINFETEEEAAERLARANKRRMSWQRRQERSASSIQVREKRLEYVQTFLQADAVYASPLTRAIETAYVAMEGHEAMSTLGLTLYSMIREFKGIGGIDCVGIETGNAIYTRVSKELEDVLGKQRAEELMIEGMYVNDAEHQWWTNMQSYESTNEQAERIKEFLSFVQHCPAQAPVFVGHSLFFKTFYSKRISKLLDRNRPALSSKMRKYRLANATLMAVTVAFPRSERASYSSSKADASGGDRASSSIREPIILDADILFGGGFADNSPPPPPPPAPATAPSDPPPAAASSTSTSEVPQEEHHSIFSSFLGRKKS